MTSSCVSVRLCRPYLVHPINNRVSYTEPDFHPLHNFGFCQTNWAGEAPGEIGGLFWRTEPEDPNFAYYADPVGELTLDDPIEFSGSINFTSGMSDAAMFIGYFNDQNHITPFKKEDGGAAGWPLPSTMGLSISDLTRVGWYFETMIAPTQDTARDKRLQTFQPDRKPHAFFFKYDPAANGGVGSIRFGLDGKETTMELSRDQREAGSTFTRFGLVNIRRGGNSVTAYFDDLRYTARRAENEKPAIRPSKRKEVPYPRGGRGH